ncbi:MAG: CBS domain-containing protein [Anaerolineales bacterium]|nr:CBS domain-containing protein [Anaerolineales bacterium]
MHAVITHEQADFDALASLLAVCLLEPAATAVLPRKINRNVRSFLTLYGFDLPVMEYPDLSRKPIKRVTLVDTQTLPSLKGIDERTQVCVIDHHPAADLPTEWELHLELTGANTTLLVETMQKQGLKLDFSSATLMLLGIYEDTGSLSYAGTTPRDIRAAAWLLEQGANLSLAADFLNHPLSDEQFKLYSRMLDRAEYFRFYGLSVVVCRQVVQGFVDEISTVAHKLRDLLDPDGLFLLVQLDSHIQLVARSASDLLDVSRVAEHFGGGGHPRAAAALIRGMSLDSCYKELMDLLHKVIQPPRTVGQIMSRGPQVLAPDTSVAEAAEQMRRFGHEGYPVVDQGKMKGLLTRRAVDRAMAHRMDRQPVSQVMEAGAHVIRATDSVQQLQKKMMDTGWGQIPVTDPIDDEIIGIVTRTDLLKILSESVLADGTEHNLAEKLEAALPGARLELLKLIARQAEGLGVALYVVGGFVRDLLLETPSVDYDLVVEGDSIRLAQTLVSQYGGRLSSHRRFGTAKWTLDPQDPALVHAIPLLQSGEKILPDTLDFVTARTEFYPAPTALPSVERGSINLDLHRRDFTINTLALRLDGRYYAELLDYWGGGQDLERKQIRVLHSLSFIDDPTRMLRAVRLEQRLGFQIEDRTLELIRQALPLLDRVSGERIRSELQLIYREQNMCAVMSRLSELAILEAIDPALKWDSSYRDAFMLVRSFSPPSEWRIRSDVSQEFFYTVVLMKDLQLEEVNRICSRLHFPRTFSADCMDASLLLNDLRFWQTDALPSDLVCRLDETHERAVLAAWLFLEDRPSVRAGIDRYLRDWRFLRPSLTGDDLRERGIRPGPLYREILDALQKAWIDGTITTVREEHQLLETLLLDANA